MKLRDASPVERARYVLTGGRWFLITGLVFYSLMTTTPFVAAHSSWSWTGWALGLIVDMAFVMALSAESSLARHCVTGLGKWPVVFGWFTGAASTFLNVWLSIAAKDWVGVAVHLIAPALVLLLAEVGPVYVAALSAVPPAEPDRVNELPHADDDQDEPDEAVNEEHDGNGLPDDEDPATGPGPTNAPGPPTRLSNAEAAVVIEKGWKRGLPAREVATAATRHPATVKKKFKALDAAHSA